MKFVAALLFAFTGTAMACPDLTGQYVCQVENQSQMVAFDQSVDKDGVTVYNYNNAVNFRTDNQTYDYSEPGLTEGKIRSWCEGGVLKTQLTGKAHDDRGAYIGDIDFMLSWTKEGNNLKQMMDGSLKSPGAIYPVTYEVTCQPVAN